MSELINVLNEAITQAINERDIAREECDRLKGKIKWKDGQLDTAENTIKTLREENAELKNGNEALKDLVTHLRCKVSLLEDETGDLNLELDSEADEEETQEPEQADKIDVHALLDTKLEDMGLHSRAYTLLSREGIKDLRDILDYPALDGNNTTYKFTVLSQFGDMTVDKFECDLIDCFGYDVVDESTKVDGRDYWALPTSEELIEKFSEVNDIPKLKDTDSKLLKYVMEKVDLQSQE